MGGQLCCGKCGSASTPVQSLGSPPGVPGMGTDFLPAYSAADVTPPHDPAYKRAAPLAVSTRKARVQYHPTSAASEDQDILGVPLSPSRGPRSCFARPSPPARQRLRRRSLSDPHSQSGEIPGRAIQTPAALGDSSMGPWKHYTAAAKQALAKAVEGDDDPSLEWSRLAQVKGLEDCVVEVSEYDSNVLVRVQCTMNASREDIVAVLEQGDGGPKGTQTEVLERPHPRVCLMWIGVKLPIVKDRDFVCCQWIPQLESEESTATVVRVSVPTDVASELRPEIRKYVRGTIVMQCTFITPHPEIPGKCTVKWLSCVDPGGFLPTIKQMTGTKGGEAVLALQKVVLEQRQRPRALSMCLDDEYWIRALQQGRYSREESIVSHNDFPNGD